MKKILVLILIIFCIEGYGLQPQSIAYKPTFVKHSTKKTQKKLKNKRKIRRKRVFKLAATMLTGVLFSVLYWKYRHDLEKARYLGKNRQWFKIIILLPSEYEVGRLEKYDRIFIRKIDEKGIPIK